MRPPTQSEAIAIYKNLKELCALERAADMTVLKIIRCPDATANQIMAIHERMVIRKREGQKLLQHAQQQLGRYMPYGYNLDILYI